MNKTILIIIGGIIVLIGATSYYSIQSSKPLKEFAVCLEQKGAKFYGAYWCPHCLEQKALFKGAKSSLPYVECALDAGAAAKITAEVTNAYKTGTYTGTYLDQIKNWDLVKSNGKPWEATQTEACVLKKIEGYPTWIFADGSRESGKVELSKLAEKTSCSEPQ